MVGKLFGELVPEIADPVRSGPRCALLATQPSLPVRAVDDAHIAQLFLEIALVRLFPEGEQECTEQVLFAVRDDLASSTQKSFPLLEVVHEIGGGVEGKKYGIEC